MADEPMKENDVVEENDDDQGEQEKKPRSESTRRTQSRSGGDRRRSGGYRQSSDRSGGGRFRSRRKVCSFCVDKVKSIDWKDVDGLRRYMNSNGSIRARRKTGTCAKHQRQLAVAIKRARHLALTPYTDEHARFMGKS